MNQRSLHFGSVCTSVRYCSKSKMVLLRQLHCKVVCVCFCHQTIEGCLKKPHIMITESLMGYVEQLDHCRQYPQEGMKVNELSMRVQVNLITVKYA